MRRPLNDTVQIGLIGCGRVANHYRSIINGEALRDFNLVGVCDIDLVKAQEYGRSVGAPAFGEIDDLLKTVDPDLVVVLTPSGLHYAHSLRALESGSHVLVEKPAAMIPDQIATVQSRADELGLMYGVAFQNRLNPSIVALADAVHTHRFGKIVTVAVRLRWCRYNDYYSDGWHGTWAQDGGVINQQAIHHLDVMSWLFGPIESVCAAETRRLNTLEAEDTLVAAVRFVDGALGTIEVTTAARPRDFEASISVVGERGMVRIGGIALNIVEEWDFIDSSTDDSTIPIAKSQVVPSGYGLSHGPLLQATIDALRQGSTVAPVSGSDSISTARLVHALYRSTEIMGWVNLSDKVDSNRLGKHQK